ncbi:MAG: DJ-1/PfpI family protein, partial [Pseudorhodoplanes sp.]|nr:DJ-1/PfpI family protein [Pseudorhodoplanes sp.]
MQVNIILVQDMVQLDITGPYEVLARTPGWSIDLVAESQAPVRTDRGLTILPTQTRATARPSDILVVPGGTGIDNAMLDPAWIAYAAREIGRAQYVFGICTGSLLLAATGALAGRKAGGHWQARVGRRDAEPGEQIARLPVPARLAAGERAGRRQEERAGADAEHILRAADLARR